eukprot:3713269-Pleurochrysis_carterae.AAC.3
MVATLQHTKNAALYVAQAKFDITGQEGVVPKKVEAPELPLPISHNFEQTRSKPHATEIRRTSSMTRRPSRCVGPEPALTGRGAVRMATFVPSHRGLLLPPSLT